MCVCGLMAIFICVYAYLNLVGSCALQSLYSNRCVCLSTNECVSASYALFTLHCSLTGSLKLCPFLYWTCVAPLKYISELCCFHGLLSLYFIWTCSKDVIYKMWLAYFPYCDVLVMCFVCVWVNHCISVIIQEIIHLQASREQQK